TTQRSPPHTPTPRLTHTHASQCTHTHAYTPSLPSNYRRPTPHTRTRSLQTYRSKCTHTRTHTHTHTHTHGERVGHKSNRTKGLHKCNASVSPKAPNLLQ